MHVKMRHLLTGVDSSISKQSVAVIDQPVVASNLADRPDKAGNFQVRRSGRKIIPRNIWPLGNYKDVRWGQRVDIVERQRMIVFIDPLRGYFVAKDAGENVILIVRFSGVDRHWADSA